MNLMEKYQSLNRGIDEARRGTSNLVESKETLLLQVEQLIQDRELMQQQIAQASEESTLLQQDIQQQLLVETTTTTRKSGSTTASTSLASSTNVRDYHHHQRRRVEFLRDYAQEQRRNFEESSRTFRTNVKRLKLISMECGLEEDTAILSQAFLNIHGVGHSQDVLPPEDEEHDDASTDFNPLTASTSASTIESLEGEWHQEAMGTKDTSKDETADHDGNCHSAGGDTATAALLSYKRAFVERHTAEDEYNERRIAWGDAEERAAQRAQKQEAMQAKLTRLRTTIHTLENDMTDAQEQTRELQALTEAYRQRVQRMPPRIAAEHHHALPQVTIHQKSHDQQQQPQTQNRRLQLSTSMPPFNPYDAAGSSVAGRHSRRHDGRTEQQQQQHPHLTGRMRMDRQFGGASIGVAISGGRDTVPGNIHTIDDSDDDINDFVPFFSRNQ